MLRRDWGTNYIGLDNSRPVAANNAVAQRRVLGKIAHFCKTAIYPQQLTVPRQYATTDPGVRIYKVLQGREIDGVTEQGVRVVVQENAQQARFVVSPLLASEYDAVAWARRNMGLN